MEINKKYTDKYGNEIRVICGDTTPLNRGIVYAQYTQRGIKEITEARVRSDFKNDIYNTCYFAIWDHEFKNYTPLN